MRKLNLLEEGTRLSNIVFNNFSLLIDLFQLPTSKGIPHICSVDTPSLSSLRFSFPVVKTQFQFQLMVGLAYVCYCMFAGQTSICDMSVGAKTISPRMSWREQIQEPRTCLENQPMVYTHNFHSFNPMRAIHDLSVSSPSTSQVWMSLWTPALSR